jgi:hypothetical protein
MCAETKSPRCALVQLRPTTPPSTTLSASGPSSEKDHMGCYEHEKKLRNRVLAKGKKSKAYRKKKVYSLALALAFQTSDTCASERFLKESQETAERNRVAYRKEVIRRQEDHVNELVKIEVLQKEVAILRAELAKGLGRSPQC